MEIYPCSCPAHSIYPANYRRLWLFGKFDGSFELFKNSVALLRSEAALALPSFPITLPQVTVPERPSMKLKECTPIAIRRTVGQGEPKTGQNYRTAYLITILCMNLMKSV